MESSGHSGVDATEIAARNAGLQAQLSALDAHLAAGDTLGGWKVGLTSGAARDSMGMGFRPFGYLLESRIFASGATIVLEDVLALNMGVENEVCFTMGATLRGRVARAEVVAAIASIAPAFEIIERRHQGAMSTAERLADNLSQWGVVVGGAVGLADVALDELVVNLSCDGESAGSVAARGHIDDHFASLAALTAELDNQGRELQAGMRVITGSFAKRTVPGSSRWVGDFGAGLGTVEVGFR